MIGALIVHCAMPYWLSAQSTETSAVQCSGLARAPGRAPPLLNHSELYYFRCTAKHDPAQVLA